MNSLTIFIIILGILSAGGYVFLWVLSEKIKRFESSLISLFLSRTDSIPSLYEITEEQINKRQEIFAEILSLRKREFGLGEISKNIDAFFELESHIHHEINFIFQICNKNPQLLKNKKFLYMRDVVIHKSAEISQQVKIYKKIIHIYNNIIRYKNYSIIGLALPFQKK